MTMIVISPYDGIQPAVERYRPSSVISILDQGESAPQVDGLSPDQHLTLSVSMASAEMMKPPCPEQEDLRIRELIRFAKNVDWSRALLIHCRLGLSRSPGAAFIVQCALSPDRDEAEIANEMRILSDRIEPSVMMVSMADDILDRAGRMVDAIDNIGFGTACMAGEILPIPFVPARRKQAS